MASPDTTNDPPTLEVPDLCRACGAPLAAGQRYCLNCGRPLHRRSDLLAALTPPPPPPPPAPPAAVAPAPVPAGRSVSAMGAAVGVGLLLLAGVAGAQLAGEEPPPAPQVRVAAAPQPNVNVTVPVASGPAAPTAFVSDWSGDDGWTIALETLPKDGTDPGAVTAAKTAATAKGAEDVGALDSDEYPSLDTGEYVVYSGVFDTKKAATAALKKLEKDFPDAEVVKVSATEAGGAAPAQKDAKKLSDKALEDLNKASGDEYVEKSKKLPDKIAPEGKPPAKDGKAPGGGSGDGTVLE